jgi:hypothetical protein
MDSTTYLQSLLSRIEPYLPLPDEQIKLEQNKAEFIVAKMTRKKFRRRAWPETKQDLLKRVTARLKQNQPIHFVMPFGGYKHFWNPSHPEPDWAELFHLRYMTDYVLPILAAHQPGVILEYISEDLILPLMNNYPLEALEAYSAAFQQLILWYGERIPSNLDIRFFRVGDRFDKEEIVGKVKELLPARRKAFSQLPPEAQEQELHRSKRSVMWRGEYDLTLLTETQKRERIIESRLVELAYYDTEAAPEYLGDYYIDDNRIDTWFSGGMSPDNVGHSLSLAASHGSVVDFWIGRGVLQEHNGKFHPTIISQNQYRAVKEELRIEHLPVNLVPLKNFDSIEVAPSPTS